MSAAIDLAVELGPLAEAFDAAADRSGLQTARAAILELLASPAVPRARKAEVMARLCQGFRAGNRCAGELLTKSFERLVNKRAKKLAGRGSSADDVRQAGYLGLLEAAASSAGTNRDFVLRTLARGVQGRCRREARGALQRAERHVPFDDAEHSHLHADRAPWQRLTREEARLVLRHVPERDLELVLCVWLGGEKVTDFVDRAHPGMPARERARLANTLGHRLLRYGALLREHL